MAAPTPLLGIPVLVVKSLGGAPWTIGDDLVMVADTGDHGRNARAARHAIAHARAIAQSESDSHKVLF